MTVPLATPGSDLIRLIAGDIGSPVTRSRQPFWRCPFHEDRRPSLTIKPDGLHWKCFGCGRSGDAIDWVRERHGCSFPEAKARLGIPADAPLPATPAPHPISPWRAEHQPDPDWSRRAGLLVRECAQTLATDIARKARVWLINRGLRPETLFYWQIGCNPENGTRHGLWIERGITIPWLLHGEVTAVNVRRPAGEDKYKLVQGSSRRGLYLGDQIIPGQPTLLVEGEFDALLAWQSVRVIVNVATLGSASARPDRMAIRQLISSPLLLIAYDADEAGRQGAEFWRSATARSFRVSIPAGKDITEFHQRGGNIALWVRAVLRLANCRRE